MPQQPNSGWTAVDEAPTGWTPVSESPAQEDKTPGFFRRLAQGVGVPSSEEELKAMQPSTAEMIGGPAVTAGKMAGRYAQNLYGAGKKFLSESREAGENVGEGGPVGANLGKAGAAGTEFLLKGLLSPVGGGGVHAFGEDIHTGNSTGAAGDALAVLTNALLLKGATKPSAGVRTGKVAYAADIPETMEAGKRVRAVLPDLDKAVGARGAPKTVGELLTTVKDAKSAMNTEVGLAMQPIRGRRYVPIGIADAIKNKITPDMAMTAEGRQMEAALRRISVDYQRPWTFEQLDGARMNANARLRSFYKAPPTGQYANLKTNVGQIVDEAIVGGVQDIVYPAMDVAAGKPKGYFAALKQRQGSLIQLEEALDKNATALATRTQKIQGSPRFSTENVSAYGHPASAPGISVHRLQNILIRPNPLAQANSAVTRSFSGRPVPTAIIHTLPVRQLLLQDDDNR